MRKFSKVSALFIALSLLCSNIPSYDQAISLVKDIKPGAASGEPRALTAVDNKLFFGTDLDVFSNRAQTLWISDGTTPGTVIVKQAAPAFWPDGTTFEMNGRLVFSGYDTLHGEELWESDGTAAGTVLIKDINPGQSSA
jgi:ELWxxDGT repeat protein